MAIRVNSGPIVRKLLECGADQSKQDFEGVTPIQFAITYGFLDVYYVLQDFEIW